MSSGFQSSADETWSKRPEEYRAFVADKNRDPLSMSQDPGEKTFGTWLSRQRTANRRGRLSQERQEGLRSVSPDDVERGEPSDEERSRRGSPR